MAATSLACWAALLHPARAQLSNGGYAFPDWGPPAAASGPIPLPDEQHQITETPGVALPTGPLPGWTILPYVNVSEAFNDNIFQTDRAKRSDFITYVTPGVDISGDVSRVQTHIFYAPTGVIYAEHRRQDLLAQNLNGTATVTLVPDAAFVLLRGFASVQPTFGGIPGTGGFAVNAATGLNQYGENGFLSRANATQTQSYSVAPYSVHRFGSFGTVKAGLAYSYSNSTELSDALAVPLRLQGSGGTLNTYNEVLQFTSGEDFGRWRDLALLTGTQFRGTGVTSDAYQYLVTNQLGYAIRDGLVVFGQLGWENIRFGGIPPTRIDDATWAAGFHWTPDPDSTVTLGYGRQYGTNSVLFNAGFAPTARTRLYAQYQSGLGTNLTQLQAYALATDVDPLGSSVDPTTGAPIALTNSVIGITGNSNLYRTKTFSGTGSLDLDRDHFSLQIAWQDQQLLATTAAFPLAAQSSSGLSAIGGWRHELNPDTLLSLYASYGRQNGQTVFGFAGQVVEDTYAAQIGLSYSFTETLSGLIQYTFTDRVANAAGLSFTQNVVLIGLTKQF